MYQKTTENQCLPIEEEATQIIQLLTLWIKHRSTVCFQSLQ